MQHISRIIGSDGDWQPPKPRRVIQSVKVAYPVAARSDASKHEIMLRLADAMESPAESALLSLILCACDPIPADVTIVAQANHGPYRFDFMVKTDTRRLALEVDGYDYHSEPFEYQRDRRKGRQALADGVGTARFTAREVTNEPGVVLRDLGRLLRDFGKVA